MARPRKHASKVDDELERYVSCHRRQLAELLFDKRLNNEDPIVASFTSLAVALLPGPGRDLVGPLAQLKDLIMRYVAYYQDYLAVSGYPCRTSTLYGMVISRLYELLLVVPQPGRQGHNGVYFSGPHLAYFVARLAKDRVKDCGGKVLDPCMGSGMLLMAYLDLLVAAGAEPLDVVCERFCGLELELEILEFARLALALSCLSVAQLHSLDAGEAIAQNLKDITARAQLRQGDALQLPRDFSGDIAALLVNPPWEGPASVFVQRLIKTCDFKCAVFVSPAALWTDKSAKSLRRFVFDGNWLRELYTFINLDFALPVHSSQQYSVSVMAQSLDSGAIALCSDGGVLTSFDYAREAVTVNYRDFDGAPGSLGGSNSLLLHIASVDQLRLLRELSSCGVTFASLVATSRDGFMDESTHFWLGRELDMTMDREHFVSPQEFDSARHLPLIEGRMLEQFGYRAKSFIAGTGRSARWQPDGLGRPQFYVDQSLVHASNDRARLCKIGFQSVGSAINRRTMIASVMPDLPCGNSLAVLRLRSLVGTRALDILHLTAALLNSFVFDYQLRARLHGNNINYFLLQDCILPKVLPLVAAGGALSREQALLLEIIVALASEQAQERLRQRRPMLEALVASAYDLSLGQYSLIVNGAPALSDNALALNSRGFWRVDKELDAALRLPLLSFNQFVLLKKLGLSAYVDYVRAEQTGACDLTSV